MSSVGPHVTSPTFVGRRRELAHLAGALAAASEGRSTTIVLAGSAGLGSSRLLSEAERRLSGLSSPLHVLRGGARSGWSGVPFSPLVAALEPLFTTLTDADLPELVGPSGEELSRLLPDLRPRLGRLGLLPARPTVTAPERRQGRILEAVLGLLARLGERRPVVLMLEDLHEADAATRALATFVARISRSERLCLVVSYQPDEVTRGHPLLRDLDAMAESPRPLERIDLGPLDRDALAQLVEQVEGERASASTLLLVWERSGGSPLIAEELLAARRELASVSLTGTFEQLVVARLARRSPRARHVLRLLAPAGRPLARSELAAVSAALETPDEPGDRRTGRPLADIGPDLAAGIAEAAEHGFAVASEPGPTLGPPRGPGSAIVDVRHTLLGRAIEADLLPSERRRHRAALAVGLAGSPAEAAVHWLAARAPVRAHAASLEAAAVAEASDAPAVALAHLELAHELAATIPTAGAGESTEGHRHAVEWADLDRRTAEAAFAAGRPARAAAYAAAAIEHLGPGGDVIALGSLHERLGQFERAAGDVERAGEAFRRAVELVPASASIERARVLSSLAHMEVLDGYFSAAEQHASAAIDAARALGEAGRALMAHPLATLGVAQCWGDEPEKGIALLEEARAFAEEAGALDDLFRVYANLTTALDLLGRREEAIAIAHEGIAVARRVGQEAVFGNFLRGNAADSLFRLGRWQEGAALCRTALEWTASGVNFVNAALSLAILEIESAAGEEAGRLLGRLLLELETVREAQYSVPTYQAAASFALWRGDIGDALRVAEGGWERVRGNEDWILVARMAATLAEASAAALPRAGQRRESATTVRLRRQAAAVIQEAERVVREAGVSTAIGSRRDAEAWLDTARAFQARLDGHDDPTIWERVATAWARLGDRYQVARARWRQAEAVLAGADARPGRADARPLLVEAVAIAGELGAGPLLRELAEVAARAHIDVPGLADRGAGPTDVRPRADVDTARASEDRAAILHGFVEDEAPPRDTFGLSPREKEVLALIAQGRTNREIGTGLFISEKTVGVHVGNILVKLDVSGRVEAAAVAIRLGLVEKARR